jgi:hypothetical protein
MHGIRRFVCATMKLGNSLPGKIQTQRVLPPRGKARSNLKTDGAEVCKILWKNAIMRKVMGGMVTRAILKRRHDTGFNTVTNVSHEDTIGQSS